VKNSPRFVSIGGDCQPDLHIRRRFGRPISPLPFDLLETSIEAALALLNTDFAGFFRPDGLIWEMRDGSWAVTDSTSRCMTVHHFRSQDPEHVQQICLMFKRHARKFIELLQSDMPVVFVRRWIERDGPNAAARLQVLHETLARLKPDCVTLFLHEHHKGPPAIDGNILTVFNPGLGAPGPWEGDAALYDQHFAQAARLLDRLTSTSRQYQRTAAFG
jgi:hypothetical protein